MPTPTENFDIVVDESRDDEVRVRAIDQLEAANECDRLAEVVRMADLEVEFRELALASLGHPQCSRTLRTIVEEGELPPPLAERAEIVLEQTPAGAGP